jgi:hypothetical protein
VANCDAQKKCRAYQQLCWSQKRWRDGENDNGIYRRVENEDEPEKMSMNLDEV